MNDNQKLLNIIEALEKHEDSSAVKVLEEVGTNCADEEIRKLSVKALVNRNTMDSLDVVINRKGKGINDLSSNVAMSAVNDILELKDRKNVLKVLENTCKNSEDKILRECAESIKTLIIFS